jgi:hypothetical protein
VRASGDIEDLLAQWGCECDGAGVAEDIGFGGDADVEMAATDGAQMHTDEEWPQITQMKRRLRRSDFSTRR